MAADNEEAIDATAICARASPKAREEDAETPAKIYERALISMRYITARRTREGASAPLATLIIIRRI